MNRQRKPVSTAMAHRIHRLCLVAAAVLLALAAPLAVLVPVKTGLAQADPASPAAPAVYLVDKDATGAQTGETWDDAFLTVQDALDVAVGAEIWVAEGVYYPDEGLTQTNGDRTSTFELKQGVTLYGGFRGDENILEERDWVNNVTVLSGDLAKNDSADANGVVTDPANIVGTDNAYHVVTADSVMLSAKLDGFVITAGLADSAVEAADHRGAGVYVDAAEPSLANLIIQGNKADGMLLVDPVGYGGGMSADAGVPQCSNVTLRNNYARTSGGGMYVTGSDGGIANLTFEGNVAGIRGGGMHVTASAGSAGHSLSNLTFTGNSATEAGGGLYVQADVPSSLNSSTLNTNSAQRGGGLYASASVLDINGVSFGSNDASEHGGGLYLQQGDFDLFDVTFDGNNAGISGGGLYASKNALALNIAVFAHNTSAQGAGMYVDDGNLTFAALTLNTTMFVDNRASEDGGGLHVQNGSSGTLDGVSFLVNEATAGDGGGMYIRNSDGYELSSTDFDGNTAISGAGMFVDASDPLLTGVSFVDNQAQVTYVDDNHGGGGLYLASSNATFSDCTFAGNSAATGGGMFIDDSNPALTNVSFTGNQAGDGIAGSGGGLWNSEGSPTLTNVLFSGNACTLDGGGMKSGGAGSNPVLVNTTFSGNAAGGSGGGLHSTSPSIAIHNTVIWNNKDASGIGTADSSLWDDPDATIEYSLIQGQTPAGPGNLVGTDPGNDPQFVVIVDPNTAPTTSGDLSVKFGSPIVDVGNNLALPSGVTLDLAGNPRIYNAIVDMGAYEQPLACPPPETTRLYVDEAASGGNTGVTGADALEHLQDAFTLAANCGGIEEIWVAQGVYRPDEGVGMISDDRTETYELLNDVAVYGGFVGPGFLPEERDWQTNATILTGDVDSNDTDSGGIVLDPGNINGANSFHVVTGGGAGITAILDGFVITAGQANSTAIAQASIGGGLLNDASSPTLANLSFVGNFAGDGAGLANLNGSSPSVTDVGFQSNEAVTTGGAIINTASSPTVTGVHFRSNEAGSLGGAMYNVESDPALTDASFRGNTAGLSGGAVYNQDSDPSLTNALLSGNAAHTGAAIYNSGSSPTLVSITVSGNRAFSTGGGLFNTDTSLPTVHNSIFWNNQDSTGAGTASATIENNDVGSIPAINYSLVQELGSITHTGGNNLDRDPRFTAPVAPSTAPTTTGDYTLSIFSPAIDVGDNAANSTLTDLAGDPRLINSIIDLGAYEAPLRPVYRLYLPAILRNYQ